MSGGSFSAALEAEKIRLRCVFDIADIFLRLRGTVPTPCRRSAFYIAVEAENRSYTWLRLCASHCLPRPSAAFRAGGRGVYPFRGEDGAEDSRREARGPFLLQKCNEGLVEEHRC